LACSWVFAGNWLGDYWRQLGAYQAYSHTEFPVSALLAWLPSPVGQVLNTVVVALLLGALGAVLRYRAGTERVAMPVALAVLVTQLAFPQTGSYNMVLLLLPAVFTLQCSNSARFRRRWLVRGARALVWADLALVPWLLWLIIRKGTWGTGDQIVEPGLLLGALGAFVLVDSEMRQRGSR
jgi:hypothetical protein